MGSGPRHLGAVAAVTGLALAMPGSALAAKGFTDGVTAGEIGKHGATIWGRAIHRGPVRAEVATDDAFRHLADHRAVRARKRNDKTVQVEIDGLDPNRTYRYRFCFKGTHRCSSTGRFQTAPRASDPKTIRFAYSGDETGVSAPGQQKPFWGNFKAFKTMAGEHNDFNIDFGDTIYSDPEVPGAAIARTVQQKWGMYRKKLAVQNMRRIRATTGIYNHWDDHEFINDFSIAEDGGQLYRRSVRAFRDYMPVTYSRKRGIYRSFRWGKNLEMFFLDERSFRSAKASAGGTCDNPDTGQPDLAPTAPQSTRNVFAAVIPSLSQPVSQACKDKLNSPNRTFLGKAQRRRFLHAVETSNAKWKVVMNETPIQQFYGLPFDRWEGYAYERLRVLNSLVKPRCRPPGLPDHRHPRRLRQRGAQAHAWRATSRPPTPPRSPRTRPTRTSSSGRSRRGRSGRRSTPQPVEAGTESFSRRRSSSRRRRAASGWSARRAIRTATPR